jgi:hypothetical protein
VAERDLAEGLSKLAEASMVNEPLKVARIRKV